MKNKLFTIILLVCFMIYPAYGNTGYTLTLNGITYIPEHPVYELNNMLYLSVADFSHLTYGKIESDSSYDYRLSIQNHTLSFTSNERIARINQKTTILTHQPLTLKEQLYLPVNFLDLISYPYTLDLENRLLKITPAVPYAKTSDSYKDHIFFNSKINHLTEAIQGLVGKDKAASLLQKARQRDDYISFIDNTDKTSLLEIMSSDLLKGKSLQVGFRQVDFLAPIPKVGALEFMPLKVHADNLAIYAEIGKDKLSYNCIWAAYKPGDKDLKIDVSKSLDGTLMRMLYEYYRDNHDLKDDLYFSPVMTIRSDRIDTATFTAYSDHLVSQMAVYDIIIYRLLDDSIITYIVDFTVHQ